MWFAGSVNASFCPAVSGCRKAAVSDGGGDLDFDKDPWQQPTISVTVPPNKTLVLVSSRSSRVRGECLVLIQGQSSASCSVFQISCKQQWKDCFLASSPAQLNAG